VSRGGQEIVVCLSLRVAAISFEGARHPVTVDRKAKAHLIPCRFIGTALRFDLLMQG
jgi:hypothetical protein